jgi:hypothetical protein
MFFMISLYEVDRRLMIWADWALRSHEWSLGYARQSLEGRLMTEGVILQQAQSRPLCHFDAEEIETYLRELMRLERKLVVAIRESYLSIGSNQQKAERLGCSCSQFKIDLACARYWLAGRLHKR